MTILRSTLAVLVLSALTVLMSVSAPAVASDAPECVVDGACDESMAEELFAVFREHVPVPPQACVGDVCQETPQCVCWKYCYHIR